MAAALLALEYAASLSVDTPGHHIISHPQLNHTWRPRSVKRHTEVGDLDPRYPEPYTHTYNKQGWIERYDIAKNKPGNVTRIFYVGDSFVEGTVPMGFSVPDLVERYLNAACPRAPMRFEVVNTGTSSYSPLLYYILIRYYIAPYAPDLIVVNIDMTDVFNDWEYAQTLIRDDRGDPYAVPPQNIYARMYVKSVGGAVRATRANKLRLFLYEHSHLYNLIMQKLSGSRFGHRGGRSGDEDRTAPGAIDRWAWCRPAWDAETEQDVAFTMGIVEKIAEYCRRHGIKLLLTGVPHYRQMAFDRDGQRVWSARPHDEIRKVAEKTGTVYLDSIGFMEPSVKKGTQPDYYLKNNMHMNARGCALWARAHIAALTDPKNKLLPEKFYQANGLPEPDLLPPSAP